MVRKMKIPFLKKNTSSSSSPSSSSSSSSSWPCPSCHQQNPKTIFKPENVDESNLPLISFFSPSSSFSSTSNLEIESIENVIKEIKSSKRLIFEERGTSNSILEDSTKREEDHDEEGEGFMLLSLKSKDPYLDFKNSMEKMIEAHRLQHDWKGLENLLFWYLKSNVKTNHRYIFSAFVDMVFNLLGPSKDVSGESDPNPNVVVKDSLSSSRPISLYTLFSSSDETSSTYAKFLPETSMREKSREGCCLSSLFELEEKIDDNIDLNDIVPS